MDEVAKAIYHFSLLMEEQNVKLNAVLKQLGDVPKIQDFRRLEGKINKIDQRFGTVEAMMNATDRDTAGSGVTTAPDIDWSQWIPVLEKVLAHLKILNVYLRGEIKHGDYCKRVGIVDLSQNVQVLEATADALGVRK